MLLTNRVHQACYCMLLTLFLLASGNLSAQKLLLTLEPGTNADSINRASQHAMTAESLPLHAKSVRTFPHLPNVAVVTLSEQLTPPAMYSHNLQQTEAETIAFYRQLPGVRSVERDHKIYATATPNDPLYQQQWYLQATQGINMPPVWDVSTGDDELIVAVIDSGIDYLHPDLAANIWQNPSELANGIDDDNNGYIDDLYGINPASNNSNPMDTDGHGTQVAGIIAAETNNSTGGAGVNWRLKLLACRFMDENGEGFVSDAIECLNYLLELKLTRGANIIASNNSWGSASFSQALYNAIAAHQQAGILFIASAGNDSTNVPFYPAAYDLPNIISVAAHDQQGNKASFSSFGRSWVDIAAPGTSIRTTTLSEQYTAVSGTSMSAPVVTGVAALLKSAFVDLTMRQIRGRLMVSGKTPADATLQNQTQSGKLLLAGGEQGAFSCDNETLARRILPETDVLFLESGTWVDIQLLSIDCNGNSVAAQVTAGSPAQPVAINDLGQGVDRHAGDALFTGSWQFDGTSTTLNFPDGPVQVQQRNDDFCQQMNVSEIPLAQCEALVQLFYDTNGQDWLQRDNWLVSNTPCNWFGVSCRNNDVIALELPQNNLVGTVPDALAQLTLLTTLDLHENNLSGSFPSAVLQLINLQHLLLWRNAFSGALPAEIGLLNQLTELDLSYNRFTGPLPSSITNLVQLQRLFLENNQLTGNLPENIGQLTQLQVLWLSDNDFSGILPLSLRNLSQMRAFGYANTSLCPPDDTAFSAWLAGIELVERSEECVNVAPVVSAGANQQVNSSAVVQLEASASDANGDALSYQWQQISGPAVVLTTANQLSTRFTAPQVSVQTALRFRFTVSDGDSQNSADVTITVLPVSTPGTGDNAGSGSGGSISFYWLVVLFGYIFRLRHSVRPYR